MRRWLMIAAILLAVGVIGVGVTAGDKAFFNLGAVEINEQIAFDGTDTKELILSLDGIDVTVVQGSTNKITATLTGKLSKKLKDDTRLNVVHEGETAQIGVDTKQWTIGISVLDLQVRLELPQQQYDSFVLKTGSGNLNLVKLAAKTVDIKVDSGEVQLDQLTATKLSLELGSGDSEFTEVSADTVELEGDSANVIVEKLKAQKLSVKMDSGDINMKDVEAELKVKADMGNVQAEMSDIKHPMNLVTGSGDVTLNTAERPSSVQIQFSHGSGELHNEWDETAESAADDDNNDNDNDNVIFGEGSVLVQVNTDSGNLTLGQH